uniref:Kinesin light chain 4 n=1 Tax=Anthurium amnicola TaxID=1678845 RepID=A0A1D1ZDL8_9ARAE
MAGRSLHRMGGSGPPPQRPLHEPPLPPFVRPPHPALLDDLRDGPFGRVGGGPPQRPLHPAVLEERLAGQHQEIQGLLIDNQRLAATHVALKQELAAAQHELQRVSHVVGAMHADKDSQLREMYEKAMKMESELRVAEAMRAEFIQVRGDVQKLNATRQELTDKMQMLTQDLARSSADLQQAPLLKAEIESMKQEVQRVRTAIEYEKKGYAENFEQGQVMEKNLIAMAREVEKLRAEVANVDKRAQAPAASGNPGAGYSGTYANPNPAYGGNPYPVGYGTNTVSGAEAAQYGSAHSSWGAYDMQRTHGHR